MDTYTVILTTPIIRISVEDTKDVLFACPLSGDFVLSKIDKEEIEEYISYYVRRFDALKEVFSAYWALDIKNRLEGNQVVTTFTTSTLIFNKLNLMNMATGDSYRYFFTGEKDRDYYVALNNVGCKAKLLLPARTTRSGVVLEAEKLVDISHPFIATSLKHNWKSASLESKREIEKYLTEELLAMNFEKPQIEIVDNRLFIGLAESAIDKLRRGYCSIPDIINDILNKKVIKWEHDSSFILQ